MENKIEKLLTLLKTYQNQFFAWPSNFLENLNNNLKEVKFSTRRAEATIKVFKRIYSRVLYSIFMYISARTGTILTQPWFQNHLILLYNVQHVNIFQKRGENMIMITLSI